MRGCGGLLRSDGRGGAAGAARRALSRSRRRGARRRWGGPPGHGKRAEAGVAIGSGVFAPFLGWPEVVVDREEQGRPFQAGVGSVVSSVALPPPDVPPEPVSGGVTPPLVVLPQIDQPFILMFFHHS